jgi:hypothetical protein
MWLSTVLCWWQLDGEMRKQLTTIRYCADEGAAVMGGFRDGAKLAMAPPQFIKNISIVEYNKNKKVSGETKYFFLFKPIIFCLA